MLTGFLVLRICAVQFECRTLIGTRILLSYRIVQILDLLTPPSVMMRRSTQEAPQQEPSRYYCQLGERFSPGSEIRPAGNLCLQCHPVLSGRRYSTPASHPLMVFNCIHSGGSRSGKQLSSVNSQLRGATTILAGSEFSQAPHQENELFAMMWCWQDDIRRRSS